MCGYNQRKVLPHAHAGTQQSLITHPGIEKFSQSRKKIFRFGMKELLYQTAGVGESASGLG